MMLKLFFFNLGIHLGDYSEKPSFLCKVNISDPCQAEVLVEEFIKVEK